MMTLDQFVKQNMSYINKGEALDSKYFNAIKNILAKSSNFYMNIKDADQLNTFRLLVDNDDTVFEKGTDADYEPPATKSYWDRPDKFSFMYTSKILPALRKKFPRVYKQVFDGKNILPAGVDEQSKKLPQLKTIWNLVAEAEAQNMSGSSSQNTNSGKKTDFLKQSMKNKKDIIQNGFNNLAKNGIINTQIAQSFQPNQLTAVAEFIGQLLR